MVTGSTTSLERDMLHSTPILELTKYSETSGIMAQSVSEAQPRLLRSLQLIREQAMVSSLEAYDITLAYVDRSCERTGITDDSDAINRAISDGNRCGPWVCDSSTDTPAVVYIPSGTYLIGKPIIFYYMTQLIGNPRNRPVLKAASYLQALALIDASPYSNVNGAAGWISTNIFLRQIRNVVIDGTAVPPKSGFQGIHWPASQATTIQNVKIIMTQSSDSKHAGIFVENGKYFVPTHFTARLC
jgi:glucan 1,3-beta-glucosidase